MMDFNERINTLKEALDGDVVQLTAIVRKCEPVDGGNGWTNDGDNMCIELLNGSLVPIKVWVNFKDINRIFINNPQWIDLE